MTKPFPGKATRPSASTRRTRPGDELFVQDVTVSVFNASSRESAWPSRTMQQFEDQGFAGGKTGNAPKGTSRHRARRDLGKRPGDPAVQLVPCRLGKVPVVEHPENTAAGVTVVVGDQFDRPAPGTGRRSRSRTTPWLLAAQPVTQYS